MTIHRREIREDGERLLKGARARGRVALVTTWNSRCGIAEHSRYLVDNLGSRACTSIFADRDVSIFEPEADVGVERNWKNRWEPDLTELATSLLGSDADVVHLCERFAVQCDSHREQLAPVVERYGEERQQEPERLHAQGLDGARSGGVGLLRDLHDLYLLVSYLDIAWTVVGQAAKAVRDEDLQNVSADARRRRRLSCRGSGPG